MLFCLTNPPQATPGLLAGGLQISGTEKHNKEAKGVGVNCSCRSE